MTKAILITLVFAIAMLASYISGYMDGLDHMRKRVFDIIDDYRRKLGV